MVYIDYETVSEALSDFGYSMHESNELLAKIDSLATEFNLEADDFVDELLASVVNLKKTEVDLTVLEHMETELMKKLKKNLDGFVPGSSLKSKRNALGECSVNQLTFNVSCVEAEDLSSEDFGSIRLKGSYQAFAPVSNSPSNAKYQTRADRFVVTQQHQGQRFVKSSASGGSATIEILSATPSDKYAVDKTSNVIDAKCERMARFAALCCEANQEISEWSTPIAGSTDSLYVYGEIVRNAPGDVPLSDQSASLLMNDEAGTVIKLDLSRLPEVTIYPGQLVSFLGSFEGGDRFITSRQFSPAPLPLAPLRKTLVDENFRMWCASGPFTTTDNCSYEPLCDLLDMVAKEQPHVLILMGPLVESKNVFMQRPEFPETYESVMNQLMRNIAKSLEGCRTEVIVQPAPFRDACCQPIFPTPPFLFSSDVCKKMGKRLHCVSDPCIARLNGIEVAFTSSEVIMHLSKTEWHSSPEQENRDRITRLNSHILEQRSLYPLLPPAIPSSIEELMKICNLRAAPHVIINSSVLAASIKNINGTIFVNPGITSRGGSGTFLRSEFSTSLAQNASDLSDCSMFEIVKF
nr:DNA polymerase alpha and DNA polymerase alpha epsilon domain containing protein [Haemonchus contortus]